MSGFLFPDWEKARADAMPAKSSNPDKWRSAMSGVVRKLRSAARVSSMPTARAGELVPAVPQEASGAAPLGEEPRVLTTAETKRLFPDVKPLVSPRKKRKQESEIAPTVKPRKSGALAREFLSRAAAYYAAEDKKKQAPKAPRGTSGARRRL